VSISGRACEGRVAVVTGSGPAASAIAAGLEAVGAVVVADDESRSAIECAVQDYGTVEILVTTPEPVGSGPLLDVSGTQFQHMIERLLWAPYALVQQVLPAMRSKGHGWILHVGEHPMEHPLSLRGPAPRTDHAASVVTAALSRMSTAMAAELHSARIAVNYLKAPGAGASPRDLDRMAVAAVILCGEPPERGTGRVVDPSQLFDERGAERIST
jgi:NAD(P)-dependent dehydrogenase (short-subunit alcohol dehydrogenase family)